MINKRLLKEIKGKKLYMAMCVLGPVLNSIFAIINSFIIAYVVNYIFIDKSGIEGLTVWIVVLIICSVINGLTKSGINMVINNITVKTRENIRCNTFKLILDSNPLKVKSKRVGELINFLTDGIENVTQYYNSYLPQLFVALITPLVILIMVTFVDPLSALIMAITYPIIPAFMMLIGQKSKEVSEKQWSKLNRLSSHMIDMLQGLKVLKAFGISKIQEEKLFIVSEEQRKTTMDVLKITFLSALVLELAATICTAVIAVDLGLRLVYDKIPFLQGLFILILTPEFYLSVRALGLKFHGSLNGTIAIESIERLERELKEVDINEKIELQQEIKSIEVRNLSFDYKGRNILNNISFKIDKNEKVALIGDSGSGKTTLINILCGLESVSDNTVFINGIDINKLNKDSYCKQIALLNQFPHIFNGSIKDNIVLGSKTEESRFNETCKLTMVDDFVEKLGINYDALLGDGEGLKISGGEKQRVSLARVMIKNASFIIMDEPTSSMDYITEKMVSSVIENKMNNKMLLISAHRINTIKRVDKIIVIDNGMVIEEGSPRELLKNKGYYYNVVNG